MESLSGSNQTEWGSNRCRGEIKPGWGSHSSSPSSSCSSGSGRGQVQSGRVGSGLACPSICNVVVGCWSSPELEMEMDDGNQSKSSLKPSGGIGKKSLKKRKLVKDKRRGKGWKKTQHSI
ncbi:hypothetical protein LWI29_026412 [Acer saccharum]|uniref:Uncharacterized protein n=1 Tax=Acer saccharum TaxID=4024 RepID=A0AA39RT21_ACESA|nr:hypothetical protein LWI29_026412 [Acer saccharum]